ncbi:hypothetical protein MYBA111488_23355 [Mycobacterium basiliense]
MGVASTQALGVSLISPNPLMGSPGRSRWVLDRLGDLTPISGVG